MYSIVRRCLKHPLGRGMIAYSVLWPTGSLMQETLSGKKNDSYDWARCARFSAYGSLFVAPTVHLWINFAGRVFPTVTLGTALAKAAVEQLTYGPAATACFFFGMTYLETLDVAKARREVVDKFCATYKVGICFWPIISTINYAFVPERNRILFVSVCSLGWTTFLAYMKQLEQDRILAEKLQHQQQQLQQHEQKSTAAVVQLVA